LTVDGYALDISSYPPEMPQAAALVDLPDDPFGADLWVVCAHFKSAGAAADIALRQRQADAIISEVGDALTIGDAIDLALNTPFLLMGDFNIYDTDPAAHYDTLVNGDIFDEDRYGPDILPDWDGSALGDALPSINQEGKLFYTWREDRSSFAPGPLDRILYTDSLLAIVNSFVLDTTKLSEAALAQFGLEKDDVLMNATPGFYDHLPIVVDFALIEE
jgi:endonuclease/exonuclease/phosphatase family metal-dependent hydrolase